MSKQYFTNLFMWWKKTKALAISLWAISIFIGVCIGGTIIIFLNGGPPTIDKTINESNAISIEGDRINIYYNIDHVRDCPLSTTRFLWSYYNYHGQKLKLYVPLGNEFATVTSLGADQKFILSLPLPKDIWPGEWFYYAKTVNQCSYLPSFLTPQIRESFNVPLIIDRVSNNPQILPPNVQILPDSGIH